MSGYVDIGRLSTGRYLTRITVFAKMDIGRILLIIELKYE